MPGHLLLLLVVVELVEHLQELVDQMEDLQLLVVGVEVVDLALRPR